MKALGKKSPVICGPLLTAGPRKEIDHLRQALLEAAHDLDIIYAALEHPVLSKLAKKLRISAGDSK